MTYRHTHRGSFFLSRGFNFPAAVFIFPAQRPTRHSEVHFSLSRGFNFPAAAFIFSRTRYNMDRGFQFFPPWTTQLEPFLFFPPLVQRSRTITFPHIFSGGFSAFPTFAVFCFSRNATQHNNITDTDVIPGERDQRCTPLRSYTSPRGTSLANGRRTQARTQQSRGQQHINVDNTVN